MRFLTARVPYIFSKYKNVRVCNLSTMQAVKKKKIYLSLLLPTSFFLI